LMPTPKWKLVVDVGTLGPPNDSKTTREIQLYSDLLKLVEGYMPAGKSSPLAAFLPGFTALRVILIKRNRSSQEEELLKTAMNCYTTNKQAGRSDADVVAMTARDFMALSKDGSVRKISAGSDHQCREANGGPEQAQHNQTLVQPLPATDNTCTPGPFWKPEETTANTSADVKCCSDSKTCDTSGRQNEMMSHSTKVDATRLVSLTNQEIPPLGMSPSLHGLGSHADFSTAGMASLGLSASQVSAMLQGDIAFGFQGA
jgi:hypothetical protein